MNKITIVVSLGILLGRVLLAGEGAFERVSARPLVRQAFQWAGKEENKEGDSAALEEVLGSSAAFAAPAELEGFASRNISNGWAPSVRLLFAKGYRERGRSTKALEELRLGWEESKNLESESGRQIGDQFLGELSQLLASLGRMEELETLFAQAKGRQFVAAAPARMWRDSHDGYNTMREYPGVAFRCGTFALTEVFKTLKQPGSFIDEPSPTNGFSLRALADMAQKGGRVMQALRRVRGEDIPVPSVIHWKQKHYAAIVAQEGNLFKVIDPTFGRRRWMNLTEINEEASGYFLAGAEFQNPSFEPMSDAEAKLIRGQGQPNNIADWKDQGCNKVPGGVGAPETGVLGSGSSESECIACKELKGMGQWWVSEPYINLFVADQPLSYQTSKGVPWKFRLTYKQRDVDVTPFDFSPILPQRNRGMTNASWSHNWISYIRYIDEQSYPSTNYYNKLEGMLYFPDAASFQFDEGSLGLHRGNGRLFVERMPGGVDPRNGSTNLCNAEISTNVGFSVTYPDGSRDLYGLSFVTLNRIIVGSAQVSPEQSAAFLTMRIDAEGRKTKICYEYTEPTSYRVSSVTDFDGNTSSFSYDSPFTDKVSKVTDPYQRHCDLEYDGSGRLWRIHDAAGLTTEIQYQMEALTNPTNSSGTISAMVTPYGTTRFSHYEDSSIQPSGPQGNFGGHERVNRAISVGEPDGGRHLYLYRYDLISMLPVSFPANEVPLVPGLSSYFDNGDTLNIGTNFPLHFRNSFYWGPVQHALLTHTNVLSLNSLTNADYARGRWRHWLDSNEPLTVSDRLSLERLPSPTNDGSVPGTKTWYGYANKEASNRIASESDGFIGQPSLIAQVLADGTTQFIEYNYNDAGRVTSQVSSYTGTNGVLSTRTRNFTYSGADLTAIGGFQGETKLRLGYNQFHQVTNATDAAGTTMLAYDDTSHNLVVAQWPNGLKMVQEASFPAHLSVYTNGTQFAGSNVFTYANGRIHAQTDLRGLTRTFSWDPLDRLSSVSYPGNQTILLQYSKVDGQPFANSTGETNLLDVTAIKDRNDHWTYFEYNPARQMTGLTNGPDVTKYVYCGCGQLEQMLRLGETWNFGYDNAGRQTALTLLGTGALANRTYSQQYDAAGRMTNVVDQAGNSFEYRYNNQGLVTEIRNAVGTISKAIYDEEDRAAYVLDAQGTTAGLVYDSLDRLTTRNWADGQEIIGYTTNFYGPTSYRNQKGDLAQYEYDAFGQMKRMTNGGVKVAELVYSTAGDLLSFQNGNGKLTQWGYDNEGRVTSRTNALGVAVTRFTYDAQGRVTNRWTLEKGDVAFGYDDAGNLNAIDFAGTAQNPDISYAYDGAGRLTNMLDEVGTTGFGYTPGFVSNEDSPFGNDNVTRGFYNGLRQTMQVGQSGTAGSSLRTYTPDANRRLYTQTTAIQPPSGSAITFASTYGYLGSGNLVSRLALGTSAMITNQYDAPMYRWNETWLKRTSGTLVSEERRAYNNAGQVDDLFGTFGNKVHFGYDGQGQITSAVGTEAGGASRLHEQFGYLYDGAGNLTNRIKNQLSQTLAVDDANRLVGIGNSGTLTVAGMTRGTTVSLNGGSATIYGDGTFAQPNVALNTGTFTATASDPAGGTASDTFANHFASSASFAYDRNGNLTNAAGRSLEYDPMNRLRAVMVTNSSSDSTRVEYVYDGLGRKRIRREYAWTGSAWGTPTVRRYVYDNGLVVQERDGSDNVLVTYTHGLDLSGEIGGAGGIGGLVSRTDHTTGLTGYYQSDQSGNVIAIVGPNGVLLARYIYDPFGNLVGATGDWAEANHFRFSSKEYDPVTGMYDFGFRWYDSSLQRWLSEDPIGERGGPNRYGFVGNAPINRVDPRGLSWYDWLNPLSYSSAYAKLQGQNQMQAMLSAHGYDSLAQFELDQPGYGGTVTAGDPAAVGAAASLTGEAGSVYVTAATLVTPTAAGTRCVTGFIATRGIGATGKIGEDALRTLGGESQVYFSTSKGARYVDQLVGDVANESKVGYQTLTPTISLQISKDAELLSGGAVQGVNWHFFQSPVTGLGGPSQPLLKALQQNGINVIIH